MEVEKTLRQQLAEMYLEYVNDWLTVECFADYYDLTDEQAIALIKLGKQIHEENVAQITNPLLTRNGSLERRIQDADC